VLGLIRRLRRRGLRKRPFPPEWTGILEAHLPFFTRLTGTARATFLEHVKLFVWERTFIGAKGLDLTDTHRVVIAGTAARLIQNLDIAVYDRLREIVVYPHDYRHPDGSAVVLGEAHHWGVVVLSFPAVLRGLANPCDGWDTALHEFAHVLDRAAGSFNGTPTLRADSHYLPWARVMQQHFDGLRGGASAEARVLRAYGGKNPAEFFAVATEAFFERPRRMRGLTPALYEELRTFYGVDPAEDSVCEE
jgi:hypothetical protein